MLRKRFSCGPAKRYRKLSKSLSEKTRVSTLDTKKLIRLKVTKFHSQLRDTRTDFLDSVIN